MKGSKFLKRATSLLLVLVMLFSFPAGAYSEGTRTNSKEVPEIPEGFVWRTIPVELAPFAEERIPVDLSEDARQAEEDQLKEKTEQIGRFLELMFSREVEVDEEALEEAIKEALKLRLVLEGQEVSAAEPSQAHTIQVQGWMPEDVTAQAQLLSYDDEALSKERILAQVELRFYQADGQRWCPPCPLTVCLDGEFLEELRDEELEPTVYVYRELPQEEEEALLTQEIDYQVNVFSAMRAEDEEKEYECELEQLHADVWEGALTQAEELPEDAVCFDLEAEEERFCFILTARQPWRTFTAAAPEGDTEMVLVGTLPQDVTVGVEELSAELEVEALPGQPVLAWALSMSHPDELFFQPDSTLKLALRNPALEELATEDCELQLWQLQEGADPARVKDALFQGEQLRFSASEPGTFLVVQVAQQRVLNATEADSYAVQLSGQEEDALPQGMEVREILPDEIAYTYCLKQALSQLDVDGEELQFVRIFDVAVEDNGPTAGSSELTDQLYQLKIDLLSEELTQSADLQVVDLGQQTHLQDVSVKSGALSFGAAGSTVYVVLGFTVEKTVTASDGNTYEISVTYDKNAGIPAGAELQVKELTGADYDAYFAKTADFLKCQEEEMGYTRLFDISLVKDGLIYEPDSTVSVSIRLLDQPEAQAALQVVHFGEAGTELLESETAADGTLNFQTDSFSIYAITDPDGNVLVPRAFYSFYDTGSFMGRQIIKNGGTLVAPEPQTPDGMVFLGWYIVMQDGTLGDQIVFTQSGESSVSESIQVVGGDQELIRANRVVVPTKQESAPGVFINHVNIRVEARYTSSYVKISYLSPLPVNSTAHPKEADVADSVVVPIPEGMDSVDFELPGAEKWDIASYEQFMFVGWSDKLPPQENGRYNYYSNRDARNPIEKIQVSKSDGAGKNLYPVFKQAHWLRFETCPGSVGANHVPAVYVLNSETTNGKRPDPNPSWRGHDFRYWTETPLQYDEAGLLVNPPADIPEYRFNERLSADKTLYAYWESNYSSYTVVVWKQSVEDHRDLPDSEKTYKFDSQYVFDSPVGSEVNLQTTGFDYTKLDTDPSTRKNFAGFQHKINQDPTSGGLVDTVEATVMDNGSTVLNVYYDRKMVYIKFFDNNGNKPAFDHYYYLTEPAAGNQKAFWFYGLYGQTLEKYGYSWPTDYTWAFFHDHPTWSQSSTVSQEVFLEFVLFDSVKDPNEPPVGDPAKADYEETEIRMYRSTKSAATIYYHFQRPDGTFPQQADMLGNASSKNSNIQFDDILSGYTVYGYQLINYGSQFNPAVNNWTRVSQTNGQYPIISMNNKEMHVAYSLNSYSISYFDSLDGQPLSTLIQDGSTELKTKEHLYTSKITQYYPHSSFTPSSQLNGWRFNGRWYSDKDCTVQIFFGPINETKLWYYLDSETGEKIYVDRVVSQQEVDAHPERRYDKEPAESYSEMPNRNLALYAGFSKIFHWVKFDPNGGELDETDRTFIRVEQEQTLKDYEYVPERNYIADDAGSWYYHYDELDLSNPEDQPATRKAYYSQDPADSTELDDGSPVRYRPVEDQEEEGFSFLGWYRQQIVNGKTSYARYTFTDPVTSDLVLKAMWRQKGIYRVYYSINKVLDTQGNPIPGLTVKDQNVPSDPNFYGTESAIPIQEGVMEIDATGDDVGRYVHAGWFVDKSSSGVYANGNVFFVDKTYLQRSPISNPDTQRPDTFILYPVFRDRNDAPTDPGRTKFILDANGGTKNEAYTQLPLNAVWNDQGTQVIYKDKDDLTIGVNMDGELPLPINVNGNNVFLKGQDEFLGWAYSRDAIEPEYRSGQIVAADNDNTTDSTNVLYAVWRPTHVDIQIRLVEDNLTSIVGGRFTLKDEKGNEVPGTEEGLVSVADGGYLHVNVSNNATFTLKTPLKSWEVCKYTLEETLVAPGYIPLSGPVTITVEYSGKVLYQRPGDKQEEAKNNCLFVYERPAICTVNNTTPFGTLRDAVAYAETLNGASTIKMLVDYEISNEDREDYVTLSKGKDITLTTADKNDHHYYRGSDPNGIATITRGKSGNSLFTVENGSLTLKNITLDGGSKFGSTTHGGLVWVKSPANLILEDTTLRNSKVSDGDNRGGAICLEPRATATIQEGVTITGNKAPVGAGIYVAEGAVLSLSAVPNFGGSGVNADGSLNTAVGNFSTVPLTNATNAQKNYANARQDIYLAETGDDPASLVITKDLASQTGSEGSIWVYAKSEKHHQMRKPFAVVANGIALSEDSFTYTLFRNACEDSLTSCGVEYLTGQPMAETNFIQWTGGVDVKFLKIDGDGDPLSGATFGLYTDMACTEDSRVLVTGENNQQVPLTATSQTEDADGNNKGVVSFEKLNAGIYYMKETAAPDPYEVSDKVYVLLVGADNVKVPDQRTEIWAGLLADIDQAELTKQVGFYEEKFELKDYAIFQIETTDGGSKALAVPSIGEYGVLNRTNHRYPVILSKVNTKFEPLPGAKFTLRAVDRSVVTQKQSNGTELKEFGSDASGVFFAGQLPYGIYYLEETQAPDGYRKPTHFFVFQVTETGVKTLRKSDDQRYNYEQTEFDDEAFKPTNTLTESLWRKFLIPMY